MKLNEVVQSGNYAFLYHGTEIWSILHIIEDGEFKRTDAPPADESEPDGISCSRFYPIAAKFANRYNNAGGVFVFDTTKVKTHYKIIPFAATGEYDEYEERILCQSIPLYPYCIALILPKSKIETLMNHEAFVHNVYVTKDEDDITKYQEYIKGLQALIDSPLRRDNWS